MGSKNIVDHFGDLPDPREDSRRHLLLDIVVMVICASISGAEKWNDIEAFGRAKKAWLRRCLALWRRSVRRIGRLFCPIIRLTFASEDSRGSSSSR